MHLQILPEAKQLKGIYLKAFQKICNIVEDSGWLLKGDEEEFGVEMVKVFLNFLDKL